MLLLEDLRNSEEIKIHLESGLGYCVVENKLISFDLHDIDDSEIGLFILENSEQVSWEHDIKRNFGEIYEYLIHNGESYDLESHCSLFSCKFLTEKEFNEMCKTAQEKIKQEYEDVDWKRKRRPKSVYDVKFTLKELYPDVFLDVGLPTGFCTNEWGDD